MSPRRVFLTHTGNPVAVSISRPSIQSEVPATSANKQAVMRQKQQRRLPVTQIVGSFSFCPFMVLLGLLDRNTG
jgi:hypothetical protein